MLLRHHYRTVCRAIGAAVLATTITLPTEAADRIPISDAHLHYSHDSVEMTPPEKVIELMRQAGLKRALVSSSDDNGTQLLSKLAPDLIIPGLRPYRRRGETGTWFKDPAALAYVEKLLATNRYATIGEFHLYGEDADLPIPRRIVQLAAKHNLILHAHSDADAVARLFAQDPSVKILWAHSGFTNPAAVADMLKRFPNLWADMAFRSDMAEDDDVNPEWRALFEQFPQRMMLGTDSFTPERIYFVPDHAEASRRWLSSLPDELAQNIGWRNAENLLMPVWERNRKKPTIEPRSCEQPNRLPDGFDLNGKLARVQLQTPATIEVSKPFSIDMTVCSADAAPTVRIDALMPKHGHGMNYRPPIKTVSTLVGTRHYRVDGLILHMPGTWQWQVTLNTNAQTETLTADFQIQ